MRTLLKTLGITPGGGLDVLIRRASQVHRLRTRVGELEVSRTSLLYVAATIEPLVLTLFEANGLNFRTWEQSLGFQERPRFEYVEHPLDDLDFPVYRETTGAALEEFQSRWPKRPLDALGLTAAILIHESAGQAKRHLENAGLDLSTATKRFRQFVDASPDSSLVNPQAVPLPLSDLTNKILIAGRDVAMRHNIAFPGLTTSELFIGATGTEAPPPRAPAFLRTFIVNHATADRFEAYVNEWMAFYDRSEDSSHEIPFLTQPVAAILERARFIAEHAAKAEMISARHLVGALIASPRWAASSGVTDFLLGLQINLHVLAQAYYDYLSTAPVERRRDDLAIWRTFLGLPKTRSFRASTPKT